MSAAADPAPVVDKLIASIVEQPANPSLLVLHAQRHLARRDWDAAETVLRRAYAIAPSYPLVLIHLSAAYNGRGDGETAAALTRSALAVVRPEVEPSPDPEAPTVLVLHASGNQPFKVGANGAATMALGTNLHFFVDRGRFRVVRAFAETLLSRLETLRAIGRVDAVLNMSVDADTHGHQFELIDAVADMVGAPVVNPTAPIAGLGRAENYQRLADVEGLLFPRTLRVEAEALTGDWVESNGFSWPVILRNTKDHFGGDAAVADGPAAVAAFRDRVPTRELFVIQYVENRIERPGQPPIWRRLRVAFFDGRPVPVNLHFDIGWNVHGRHRDDLMQPGSPEFEQEKAFLEDWRGFVGPVAEAALLEIARRTPVDYVGVDFTLLPDGRALVFEVNPAMALLVEHAEAAPHIRTSMDRYRQEMTRLLLDRIGARD